MGIGCGVEAGPLGEMYIVLLSACISLYVRLTPMICLGLQLLSFLLLSIFLVKHHMSLDLCLSREK